MNDQQKPEQPNTDKMGKNMLTVAWIIAIGMATWLFSSIESNRLNPNQSPVSTSDKNSIKVELLQNRYGHYLSNGFIDGKEVTFMLDTGATDVAIPGAIEEYLNLRRGQRYYVHTANGKAEVYATRIESLQIGDIVLNDIRASIVPSMEGEEILLGMSALKQVEFRQKGRRLTLLQWVN